ncbi:solute carrier organic anion transporter family member 1C1-like [Dipodomys merriami]|uniref:solute carrier organic anion transporter family member 1C1-like n=1 Tax=Dipodomys merriami TaxID=94247 RepID=UPI003855B3EB
MDGSTKENIQLFSKSSAQRVGGSAFKTGHSSPKEKQPRCCRELKVFLGALSFVYFAKALGEGYLKSTITQIEKRFDISSSLVGLIDGSFEIGNLLVIIFVSYFGAKLHRPKAIGAGCVLMGAGTLLIALPHFIMEPYKYGKLSPSLNASPSVSACVLHSGGQPPAPALRTPQPQTPEGCSGEGSPSAWAYVFLGNLLRGLGETPIQPLGIAYLDDFSGEDDVAFYIGCVQGIAIIGPIFGFLLGSLCAKLYVDVGFVNAEHLAITPADPQWVGAWWLGYLVAGAVSLLAAVPFWCFPKSLPRPPGLEDSSSSPEKSQFILDKPGSYRTPHGGKAKMMEMAKDFVPSLKSLLGNPVYMLYVCASTVQFNSLFGMVTYKPKYIEQQYGQTSSRANFVIGLINIPAVALGIFSGGMFMKKFRISVCGAARLSLASSILGYLLFLSLFALGCEPSAVAGLTVSYRGTRPEPPGRGGLLADCNARCQCSEAHWEPVCGADGVTYASACLAGCQASRAAGRSLILYNCSCVAASGSEPGNSSGMSGRCQKDNSCSQMFLYFLVISVISSYTLSLGGIPGYIILLRSIKPQLKSFALGIYTLAVRVLAGIPAPVYFGVLIDSACLQWGVRSCGSRGSCRFYDSGLFRHIYLGLTVTLGSVAIFLSTAVLFVLKKNYISKPSLFTAKSERSTASTRFRKERCTPKDHPFQSQYWPGKETEL